jgi:hypothetical protein
VKSTDYSEIPHLEFRGFSKTTMLQGVFQEDSVFLNLYFTDGDGDFGSVATDTSYSARNIFITDLRTNMQLGSYKSPFVPLEGAGNGVSGKIKIKLFTTCCIFPTSSGINPCTKSNLFPKNELPLEIYIKDRAGHVSNTVKADVLILDCQ